MAANFNKVFLIGNLTRDPEVKFTPQGTAIARLGIAVNRQYKASDGEFKKEVNYFTIVVWGKNGENCGKFLSKGRAIHVEGRLQTRSYETQDGQKRSVTEIVADSVQFLGGSGGSRDDGGAGFAQGGDADAGGFSEGDDSDVPF